MKETFGQRFARLRKNLGFKQDDIAEKVNISAQAVSKWENDLSIPDLPLLIEIANIFNVSMDELLRQKENTEVIRVVEEPLRKSIDQMMLRIVVNSSDGDKVRINLPMAIIKVGLEIGMNMPQVGGKETLKDIDFDQILMLVEQGVVGKLVEVESSDGDLVEIFVE